MKTNKRILIALFTAFMCIGSSNIVLAATPKETSVPDEIVLYEDENILVTQGTSSSELVSPRNIMMSRAMAYGNVWCSRSTTGSFNVYNTVKGSTGVTWKVESSDKNAYAQMYMMAPNGLVVLATRTVRPSNGDVRFTLKNGSIGNYRVHYIASTNSSGMRVMCWMY